MRRRTVAVHQYWTVYWNYPWRCFMVEREPGLNVGLRTYHAG